MSRPVQLARRHMGQILTVISGVLLALFTIFPGYWDWVILIVGVACALGAIMTEGRKQDANEKLAGDLAQAKKALAANSSALELRSGSARTLAHNLIVDISRLCDVDENTVRASIYERREGDWVRVARYSASAAYRGTGRLKIPLGAGLLQRAFERAHAEAVDLPVRERAPAQYEREQARLGLEPAVSGNLTMPSRSYALFRFEGPPTEPNVRTFVLCLESTEPQGVIAAQLWDQLTPWWWSIHRVCSNLEPSKGTSISELIESPP